jgi:hypothetical protein
MTAPPFGTAPPPGPMRPAAAPALPAPYMIEGNHE